MKIEKIKECCTGYLGQNILYYPTIDSTQLEAQRKVMQGVPNGSILLAGQQTQGKGTKGRKWYTGSENIAMTIILYPDCKIDRLQGFTYKIAKVMQETIYQLYSIHLTIKEPNDLLLNGYKIGGILTQSKSAGEKVQQLLIGIGFNVNETEFPVELHTVATSLKREYQKNFEVEEIIKVFLEKLEQELNMILS